MKVHCETPFWSYAKEPHLLVEPHQTLGNGEKTHGSQRKNGGKNLQLMNLCVCVYTVIHVFTRKNYVLFIKGFIPSTSFRKKGPVEDSLLWKLNLWQVLHSSACRT